MKSLKLRISLIVALALSFLIAIGSFLGITFAGADRSVTISGTSVFVTTSNAKIWAHREVTVEEGSGGGSEGEGEGEGGSGSESGGEEGGGSGSEEITKDYSMFTFTDDEDAVGFRKNLAYAWYENAAKEEEADSGNTDTPDDSGSGDSGESGDSADETDNANAIKFKKAEGYFNMEIGFADDGNKDGKLQFKKFVITFESQQYTQTKDGKSTNYIIFVPDADDNLDVFVTDKQKDEEDLDAVLARLEKNNTAKIGTLKNDHIKISFTDRNSGEYGLKLTDGTTTIDKNDDGNKLTFKNVGKTFATYSSSTTTPVTPISFKALFTDKYGEENDETPAEHGYAFMTMYNLNGQSFELKGATEVAATADVPKHFQGGTVNDLTPPVLCLNKGIQFIKMNDEITFNYTVIDVLTTSPSLTMSYYMLTDKTAQAIIGGEKAPEFKEEDDKTVGDFKSVSDSDDQYIFPHNNHYIPDGAKGDYKSDVYDDSFEVKAAVKVVLKLIDTTASGKQTAYVYLDWFIDENYLINLGGTDDEDHTFIAVTTDNQGVTYAYTDTETKKSNPDETSNDNWETIMTEYRDAVEEAAKDLKAGSKNYFYLPSAEKLFKENATAYEDLTFSIYYNNGTQQQNSSKSANELSINITKSGKYVFTVYAADAVSNKMYYFVQGADGNSEKVEFDTSDIWNMYKQEDGTKYAGRRDYLPWFEFVVEESEISIEDPDEQSTAYVGSSFSPDSFEINGVSVNTVYTLYQFENDLWAADNGGNGMSPDYFVKNKDTLLQDYRRYFTRIRPSSELESGTADYEKFNPYGWNGTSLSFTPQVANTFYLIRCEASSSETAEPVTKCMAIASASKVKPLKGEDTWVQDNMTSIILLTIAGASLIGIVLLLVIRPKNKTDVDEAPAPKKVKKK